MCPYFYYNCAIMHFDAKSTVSELWPATAISCSLKIIHLLNIQILICNITKWQM